MLLADGARFDLMQSLLQAGELPNIAEHIVSRGGFKKGVTVFPSTTGPAYIPFLMGCLPGTVNVTGIRWFDKQKYKHRSYVGPETLLMRRDISKQYRMLFEIFPKSYSLFSSVYRGPCKRDLTGVMRLWYAYYAHLTDHWHFLDTVAAEKTLKQIEKDFQLLFTVLPGIDEHSHMCHPHHEATLGSYRFLDKTVGEIAKKLKALGRYDETLLWIFSDHGLTKTDTHFCVNTFLEEHGIPPFYYPKILHRLGKKAANMVSGNGMTHLYFKGDQSWNESTPREYLEKRYPNLISDLLKEEAVDLLAVRNQTGGVDVLSKLGEATIQLEATRVSYQVVTKDPFGFNPLPKEMDAASVLEQTINSTYPDAIWQLAHLFKASRTGDIVLSAKPGFDLRKAYEVPEHKGSHGSLHVDHMLVPILTNADFPESVLRTIDVFPTTLALLGVPIPKNIDGISRLQCSA